MFLILPTNLSRTVCLCGAHDKEREIEREIVRTV